MEKNVKSPILNKNLKIKVKDLILSKRVCNYEGCGADDGWPN